MINPRVKPRLTRPRGRARSLVLGFLASTAASARRLKAMAALLAPTIASRIKKACRAVGSPRAPMSAPMKAKGSANTVCWTLIISRMILNF